MSTVPFESAHFAQLVAPVIDRVFRGGMRADRSAGGAELARGHGSPVAVLIEFRTALGWPGRSVSWAGFEAVMRYGDPAAARASVAGSAGRDWSLTPDGFRATESGREFVAALLDHQGATLSAYWPASAVDAALPLVGTVLAAAGPTGGAAFAAMAPPYEPATAAPAVVLLNRLGTLRYHRSDAHAAAWAAAGLSAPEMVALPDGPQRDAIEAETDRRAAPPYDALTADERTALLSALADIPG